MNKTVENKSNIKAWAIGIITFVILTVVAYASTLLWIIEPFPALSLEKTGLFGDSFGLLTSFFSGLAFSGMLIAVLLQREELKVQREELIETRNEFKKSAEAQQLNAKLNALSSILIEYKAQIEVNDKAISKQSDFQGLSGENPLMEENQFLYRNKNIVITEIETILISNGIPIKLNNT